MLVFFMEGTDWLLSKNIDLNGTRVDLGYSLELEIITPLSIFPFSLNIVFDIADNIVLKESLLEVDVIHTQLPNLRMILFITIKLI